MGLFIHKNILPKGEIGIWQITEPEFFFNQRIHLFAEEQEQLSLIKGKKRLEWLATRYLVHVMSGRHQRAPFLKDEFGKPYLQGSDYQVSISHSHGMAAAIAAPHLVGIDIQFLITKIGRIAHKFTRAEERATMHPDSTLEHLHVYWGAKEALYKAYGRRQIDFCEHLIIEPFAYDLNVGHCIGWVKKGKFQRRFLLKYELYGQYMLVYAVESIQDQ